ncbi:MAG: hypothetical protein ACRBBW_17955 [Cellvibrionaceae bacterium]
MRSGAPTTSTASQTTSIVAPPSSGASHCWEKSILKNAIATTGRTEITPLKANGQTPLGLSLYTPEALIHQLTAGPFSSRHLIDGLLAELTTRAKDTGQRKTPWLYWKISHQLLDSAEVMELMYFIGKQFQLGDSNSSHYSVCFTPEQLDPQRAALFKGLGYNCLELELAASIAASEPQLTEQLTLAGSLCQDYHYPHFALRMNEYNPSLTTAVNRLQQAQRRLPDSIHIASCQFPSPLDFQGMFYGLRDLGYRVLGNDCFVRPGTALANAQINNHLKLSSEGYNCQNVVDIVGLGPGNRSTLNHTHYQNPSLLPQYLANPLGERFMTPSPATRLKLVIDNLLCYHQLDFKYFEDRYDLPLEQIITRAWGPLANSPYAHLNKKQLRLTAKGVLELTSLCQSLIDHFCTI